MKYCNVCKKTKELVQFNKKGSGYQSRCRDCQRSTYKDYYASSDKERNRLLVRNKVTREVITQHIRSEKNKPCTDCKISYPYYVMQFDHIGTDKKYNIAQLVNYSSIELVNKEIAKCEVVCANCHAARTWLRRQDNL